MSETLAMDVSLNDWMNAAVPTAPSSATVKALRAFESAGRHLSFTRAAEELNVTPGAINHQIKSLEDQLRAPLFHRLTRALRLTDAGQQALQTDTRRASTNWRREWNRDNADKEF